MRKSTADSTNRPPRELTFHDGTSHKFWRIELSGSSHTVAFGKVGTSGQTQKKEFETDDEAARSYDKLVAEKLKKGYVESTPPSHKGGKQKASAASPVNAAAIQGTSPEKVGRTKKEKDDAEKKLPSTVPAPAVVDSIPAVNLQVTREIRLKDVDWARATWRGTKPLVRSKPVPFDLQDCLKRLSQVKQIKGSYGCRAIRWQDLNLPSGLDPKEAHFWLTVMTIKQLTFVGSKANHVTPAMMADQLSSFQSTGQLSMKSVAAVVNTIPYPEVLDIPDEIGILLGNLLSARDLLALRETIENPSALYEVVGRGIIRFAVPYWPDSERQPMRQAIRKAWAGPPSDAYERLSIDYYLAAAFGMHPEISAVTAIWADDAFPVNLIVDTHQHPQELLFGLDSADQIASEWRRLKLNLRSPAQVRAFLACTEFRALEFVRNAVLRQPNKEACDEYLALFALVIAPEAAPFMLELQNSAKSPAIARQWLEENVGCAIAGLLETAAGRSKLAEPALDYLRMARSEHRTLIEQGLKGAPPDIAARIRKDVLDYQAKVYSPFDDATTPSWLLEILSCHFYKHRPGQKTLSDDTRSRPVKLKAVDPIVRTEVIADLYEVTSKVR